MRLGIRRSVALVAISLIFAIGFTSSQNVSAVGILGDAHVHANLEVTILGDKFDFSSSAYQIKSSWIHFESQDGDTIHRHASDVPLGNLFDSINISLTDSHHTCMNTQNGNYEISQKPNPGTNQSRFCPPPST